MMVFSPAKVLIQQRKLIYTYNVIRDRWIVTHRPVPPFNDHESTFVISFVRFVRCDFRWWSFIFSQPNAIHCFVFHSSNWLREIKSRIGMHTHTLPMPNKVCEYTRIYRFSFSFSHRDQKCYIMFSFLSFSFLLLVAATFRCDHET